MPKTRESWDNLKLNVQLDMALCSLRRELWADAHRKQHDLSDEYIAKLIQRALFNAKWRPGVTLRCSWRYETL
jgi:hypothetical protein